MRESRSDRRAIFPQRYLGAIQTKILTKIPVVERISSAYEGKRNTGVNSVLRRIADTFDPLRVVNARGRRVEEFSLSRSLTGAFLENCTIRLTAV